MADSCEQETLQRLWLHGRPNSLSPLMQVKAWCLREAWQEFEDCAQGMLAFIASRLTKVNGSSVSTSAVHQLLARIDGDEVWFPGKIYRTRSGPQRALSGTSRALIATSAMALKSRGGEPTYRTTLASCPSAALNPATGRPVDKKRIYAVFRADCHDGDPAEPWACRPRLSKSAWPAPIREKRFNFGNFIQGLNKPDGYYYRHIIWTDLCHDVLPLTEQKATMQAQARKGKKGWMSEGQQSYSANLRGPRESGKQNSWDTQKVWWFPMLARGKLHLELLPADFPGETPAGAAILVDKVRAAVNLRFPNGPKPRILFVDRGKGFYATSTARITPEFQAALRRNDLAAFMGDDARQQPGTLAQVLLHETTVAWTRVQLVRSYPAKPWEETREAFAERLRAACRTINAEYSVEGLSRDFPARIEKLVARQGDNLSH